MAIKLAPFPPPRTATAADDDNDNNDTETGLLKRSEPSFALTSLATRPKSPAPKPPPTPTPVPPTGLGRRSPGGVELLITLIPFGRAIYLLRRHFKRMAEGMERREGGGFVGWLMKSRLWIAPKEVLLFMRFTDMDALERNRPTIRDALTYVMDQGWALEEWEVRLGKGEGMFSIWDFEI